MPKVTKKAPVKKSVRKKAAKKPAQPSSVARTRTTTATPGRAVTRNSRAKSKVVGQSRSATKTDIALAAYYIGERRRAAGLPGGPESDWLEAERQLRG